MTSREQRDLIVIALAGLAVRLFFAPAPGHVLDLQVFAHWATAAADAPWNRAYEVTDANYPPAAMYFFEFTGRAYRAFVRTDPSGDILRVLNKLPAILFDCIGAVIAYLMARRFTGHATALIAAALIAANPALIYDSAYWGQNDSIAAVGALGALYCMQRGRRVAAWVVLAFAVLNKPPVIVLAPLFLIEALMAGDAFERSVRVRQALIGIGAALVCGYLLALPLYAERMPLAVYQRMIAWYAVGSSLYPYTSANGFNVYAFASEFFKSDNAPVLFVPLKYWADLVFIGVAAYIYRRYALRPDERGLIEASFLVMLGFFLFLTEMHERYLIYALVIVPVLAAIERGYLISAGVLTVTEWLNLEYSLAFMWFQSGKPPGINVNMYAPVLARLCAAANLGVFAAAITRVRPSAALPAPGTSPSTS
ncbi:MAG: hypothetical protein NVSMB64_11810 [Candidatus Velthaea sp.]